MFFSTILLGDYRDCNIVPGKPHPFVRMWIESDIEESVSMSTDKAKALVKMVDIVQWQW